MVRVNVRVRVGVIDHRGNSDCILQCRFGVRVRVRVRV